MANCHRNFFTSKKSFHSKVKLSDIKKDSLRKSSRGLRKHIKEKFAEKDRPAIKFQVQGSFAMDTTVNPLNDDYDIDDGLYFKPQLEDRPTPETVHSWVVEAAKSYQTVDTPVDKNKCVRVPFKAGYHVDIPIYDLIDKEDEEPLDEPRPELAVKGDGWIPSDPKKLTDWFKKEASSNGTQLRRVVRYFKAWADFQDQSSSAKMPSGIILTILATEEFIAEEDGDDEAFGQTASMILERIKDDESIPNPVDDDEDFRDRITDTQFENFKSRLDKLVQHAETALNLEDEEEAAETWQKVLGDRFPVIKSESSGKKAALATPGIIKKGSESG